LEREDIKNKLSEFIRVELLLRPEFPLGDDEPLITGGLIDSMAIAQIGVFLENTFDLYLPDAELTVDRLDTLNLMTDLICGELQK
jgi:acyl carrier protein